MLQFNEASKFLNMFMLTCKRIALFSDANMKIAALFRALYSTIHIFSKEKKKVK